MAKVEEILDKVETYKKTDPTGMMEIVGKMPEMTAEAEGFTAYLTIPKVKKISRVVVLGMGGSAISGDLAADLLVKTAKVPIVTNRGYNLPEYVDEETVVIALSYSGNTEETISAVKEAAKRRAAIICLTSGGELKKMAEEKKYPCVLLPGGLQPRAALPYLLIPLISVLNKLGIAANPSSDIKEAVALLSKLKEEYGPEKPARQNPAKTLAKKIVGKVPFVFGSVMTTAAVAYRFKTQFNENSKATAIAGQFPELNHNEIVNVYALKKEGNGFASIVLRDEADNERIKKRIEITKSLVSRLVGGTNEVYSQGRSKLARMLSLVFFGDYVSVYLALLQGIDPTPVEAIAKLKRELKR
ncbi:MAG: bifunctional phosphoglucose/phosphomannose isomerase [bacterium]